MLILCRLFPNFGTWCPREILIARTIMNSWFVIGQLMGAIALNRLNATDPLDFRTPIYTQVRRVQATASA